MGPTPSGPATLVATFDFWSRRANLDPTEPPIEVRLPVNVVGDRDPRTLSAGQAMDVALSDWGFRAFLEAHPEIQLWQRRIVALDPRTNRWLVVLGTDAGASATVSIDAETGEIVWSGTQAARAPEREPPIRTP
jgi:hypothetical protein